MCLDELADMALHSESDSVRDDISSGIRSEAEEEDRGQRPPPVSRKPGQLGSTPAHLSLSTTSSLSSCSATGQARLVQSSLRDSAQPPAPPPRTSSATSASGGSGDNGNGSVTSDTKGPSDLGKQGGAAANGSKTTCMQCYLSGHSDGSLDSVDPSTEGSSSRSETATPSCQGDHAPGNPSNGAHGHRDRDSGIMEDKFDRFDPTATDHDKIVKLEE